MNILGISCGRGASACVTMDGRIRAYAMRERITRQRHAMGIDRLTIDAALEEAGLSATDVDACAIVGPPVVVDSDYLRISTPEPLPPPENVPVFSLTDRIAETVSDLTKERSVFHTPVSVQLDNQTIAGAYVDHHAAHAAAAYYAFAPPESLVITHDSASGSVFYGIEDDLFWLASHGLTGAALYDAAAARCGLKGLGSAGKLMGLASYGKPIEGLPALAGTEDPAQVIEQILAEAARQDFDLSPLGDATRLPSSAAADLAATVQRLFSDSVIAVVRAARDGLKRADLPVRHLCLGGGGALNCPTNSRLYREDDFDSVLVPPFCDNSGLSIGAAWWMARNVYGLPRPAPLAFQSRSAMQGPARQEETEKFLRETGSVNVERPIDPAQAAAMDLAGNRIIGWFEERSEAGPRALGHRSILADPRQADSAARVNAIKRRETWRPFAPACLLEKCGEWFENGPPASPFMLFTHNVREDKRARVPAITHVDGTARVQTVGEDDGMFRDLLMRFEALTGVPMVLNTSFNGPGEPIAETPKDALAFFQSTALDALYVDGIRLSRVETQLR